MFNNVKRVYKLSLTLLIVLICLVALLAGFVSGVFGGGAGLINVPGFYLLMQYAYPTNDHLMQVAIASGVSSSVLLGFFATFKQHKYKQICYQTLRWAMVSVLLGGVLGVFLMTTISSNDLKIIFALIVIVMAIWMWRKLKVVLKVWQAPLALKALSAFLAGMCTMLSGVSVFFVPFLTKCGLDIRKAIGTSTVVTMVLCLVMSGFFVLFGWHADNLPPYSIGYLNLVFFSVALIPSVIGVNVGVKVTALISHKYLQIIYIIMMLIVAITMLV